MAPPASSSPRCSVCSGPSWHSQPCPGISLLCPLDAISIAKRCCQGCSSVPAPSLSLCWWRWRPAGASSCPVRPRLRLVRGQTEGPQSGWALGWVPAPSCITPGSFFPGSSSPRSAAGPDAGRQRDLQQLSAQGPAGEGAGAAGCGGLRGSVLTAGAGGACRRPWAAGQCEWCEGGRRWRGRGPNPFCLCRKHSRYPQRRWCWKCCSPTARRSRSPSLPRTRRRMSLRCHNSCAGQDQPLRLSSVVSHTYSPPALPAAPPLHSGVVLGGTKSSGAAKGVPVRSSPSLRPDWCRQAPSCPMAAVTPQAPLAPGAAAVPPSCPLGVPRTPRAGSHRVTRMWKCCLCGKW